MLKPEREAWRKKRRRKIRVRFLVWNKGLMDMLEKTESMLRLRLLKCIRRIKLTGKGMEEYENILMDIQQEYLLFA
jgi:hypothetical protein